jgi:Tfp pilus assembly protein PilF
MPGPASRPFFLSREAALAAVLVALCSGGCATSGAQGTSAAKLSSDEVGQLRYRMAERLLQERDYEHAMPYLKKLLQAHPRNVRLQLMLAQVLREKGMREAAARQLRAILKRAPRTAAAHASLGILLDYRKRHTEAERHHRVAVKEAPGNPRYHNNLGFCLFLQSRLDDAEEALRDAIRLEPTFRRAFNNLGFVLGMQDQDEAAREAFAQAGSKALTLTNLGLLEEMRGKPLQARAYYERALRNRPGYKPAQRNLGALDPQIHPSPERATALSTTSEKE